MVTLIATMAQKISIPQPKIYTASSTIITMPTAPKNESWFGHVYEHERECGCSKREYLPRHRLESRPTLGPITRKADSLASGGRRRGRKCGGGCGRGRRMGHPTTKCTGTMTLSWQVHLRLGVPRYATWTRLLRRWEKSVPQGFPMSVELRSNGLTSKRGKGPQLQLH
ncbi:hypothetical protein BC830DRAFT_27999 [Chytriomyces sp. MP71]|nr:hypothetical protein BC830DRAFT_27999 [Chytriomyces sp. MP71]